MDVSSILYGCLCGYASASLYVHDDNDGLVGNKVLDCSAPTLHMTSLKRKLPLRTSLSVDNAPQPEFVSPTSTILNTSAVSSASSSAEDSSPHHTGTYI